jgi:hypothetical protein
MFTETIQKAPIMNGESMLDATIIVSTLDPFMEKSPKRSSFVLPWATRYPGVVFTGIIQAIIQSVITRNKVDNNNKSKKQNKNNNQNNTNRNRRLRRNKRAL